MRICGTDPSPSPLPLLYCVGTIARSSESLFEGSQKSRWRLEARDARIGLHLLRGHQRPVKSPAEICGVGIEEWGDGIRAHDVSQRHPVGQIRGGLDKIG